MRQWLGGAKAAAERLSEEIGRTEFSTPNIPVVHNVHAGIEQDAERIKALMIEQIYRPVRWVSCVQKLAASGVDQLVECGPGKVLSGLNRRIDKAFVSYATQTPDDFDAALASFNSQS